MLINKETFRLYKICVVTIMLLLCSFLVSCKATPEENIVITHDVEKFEDMLLVEADSKITKECPEQYFNRIVSKDGKVVINIDASVVVPEETELPVIQVNPEPIKRDTILWAAEEFLEGNFGTYASMSLTKTEIERWIIQFEADLADENALYEMYTTQERVEIAKDVLRDRIESYKLMLNDAPDEKPYIHTDLRLRPFDFYINFDEETKNVELSLTEEELDSRENCEEENLYLQCDVTLSNGIYSRLSVYNEYEYNNFAHIPQSVFGMEKYMIHVVNTYTPLSDKLYILNPTPFSYVLSSGSLDSEYPDLVINEQEAIDIVLEKINDMDIGDYYVDSIMSDIGLAWYESYDAYIENTGDTELDFVTYINEKDAKNKFYIITLKPMYYNVPLLEANQEFTTDESYRSPVEYEEIKVRLSLDFIAEFTWTNPMEISNVINDNVKIISFDTAIKNAESFMQLKYNLQTLLPIDYSIEGYEEILEKYDNADISITEIKLGLAGIPSSTGTGEYLLIPVWNFYGSYHIYSDDSNLEFDTGRLRLPLVTINAIDGSIVHQKATITY